MDRVPYTMFFFGFGLRTPSLSYEALAETAVVEGGEGGGVMARWPAIESDCGLRDPPTPPPSTIEQV
jgi:hypothetical protein